jgi:hypothetical protein
LARARPIAGHRALSQRHQLPGNDYWHKELIDDTAMRLVLAEGCEKTGEMETARICLSAPCSRGSMNTSIFNRSPAAQSTGAIIDELRAYGLFALIGVRRKRE